MGSSIVIGAQWGDEGKGKTIDIMAQSADVVVRSQGGSNAGHTIVNGTEVYKLHLIPSGILHSDKLNLVGCGVVIDPKGILAEIDGLKARGIMCENVRIDERAHVVMPWHTVLDELSEQARGKDDIGTTKRGIGPCYMDKAERSGIRMCELCDEEEFAQKVRLTGTHKNDIITKVYGGTALDLEAIITEYSAYAKRLSQYLVDVSVLTYNAIKAGKNVLFEGAQGMLLDLDMGTYPFVTSSHPTAGGFCVGTGIGPTLIDEVIGVVKAYTTRVGKGPFPTELFDDTGDTIRERGAEFGTTTGRPRRCGWFDAVIVKLSVRVNGLTSVAITKLDTLSNIDELKICTGYKLPNGDIITDFPTSLKKLSSCTPVYETLPGFTADVSECTDISELPIEAKRYLERIEQLIDCKITMVGVGPDRKQNLKR